MVRKRMGQRGSPIEMKDVLVADDIVGGIIYGRVHGEHKGRQRWLNAESEGGGRGVQRGRR